MLVCSGPQHVHWFASATQFYQLLQCGSPVVIPVGSPEGSPVESPDGPTVGSPVGSPGGSTEGATVGFIVSETMHI